MSIGRPRYSPVSSLSQPSAKTSVPAALPSAWPTVEVREAGEGVQVILAAADLGEALVSLSTQSFTLSDLTAIDRSALSGVTAKTMRIIYHLRSPIGSGQGRVDKQGERTRQPFHERFSFAVRCRHG